MTILQLLTVPIVGLICFVVPGYALRLAVAAFWESEASAWWDVLFGVVLASVLWTGFWALILLQLGRFALFTLLIGNLLFVAPLVVLGWRRHADWRLLARRPSKLTWIALMLLVIAGVLFLQPHEFILGGADAGVYVNLGRSIVARGDWLIYEEAFVGLPSDLYPALFRQQPPTSPVEYLHVPGFYITDASSGEITPQFYPLHPLWLAIYHAVGGLRLSLFATPLWGLLGAVAVALVTQSLFGRHCGLMAFGLLTVTATQIWFARYPTAEMLTQYLVFGGLWALIRYIQEGSVWYAILAGAALGQATSARLDVYFLVAVPIIYGYYRLLVGRFVRTDLVAGVLFAVGVLQSLLFARTRSWPYFHSVYGGLIDRLSGDPWPLLLVLALMLVGGFALWRYRRLDTPSRQRVSSWAITWWYRCSRVLAVLVVLVALYAYFLRPVVADTSNSWYYWYGDSQIPNVEPYNLVRLGWYLTPLGVALAVFGIWHLMNRGLDAPSAILVGVGLFFSVLFIIRSRNNPHHIYVMRRYVPVVIPFLVLMMSYAIDRISKWRPWSRGLAVVLLLSLGGWLLANARLEITHIEYDGLIAQVEQAVDGLGEPRGIVLFNDDLPVSNGTLLGTPLHYLYGYTVFDLQEQFVDRGILESQVDSWREAGWRVILAEGPNAVPDSFSGWRCEPLTELRATYPVLEVSYERKPEEVWTQALEATFCEVTGTK